jgi:hypothetical protein
VGHRRLLGCGAGVEPPHAGLAAERGCPWDEKVCAVLASMGDLPLLAWARANGCPWDGSTCVQAAGSGWLDCLQWAPNGCDWDPRACRAAARAHPHVGWWIDTKEAAERARARVEDVEAALVAAMRGLGTDVAGAAAVDAVRTRPPGAVTSVRRS